MAFELAETFGTDQPVVGMIHCQPLPGSPRYESRSLVRERAFDDAEKLVEAGVDALLVENYGDFPTYPDDVPKHVVAELTAVARDLGETFDCPLGINVLRNDPEAAVSIAGAVDADFVRINVHDGAAVTDQGIIEGRAQETLRLRERIDAGDVAILADAQVKHADRLRDRDLATEIHDLVERGMADGIVVTGPGTGHETPIDHVESAAEICAGVAGEPPLFVGSGVNANNVARTLGAADGVIVGTSLKEGGVTDAPVERSRVRSLLESADSVRQ